MSVNPPNININIDEINKLKNGPHDLKPSYTRSEIRSIETVDELVELIVDKNYDIEFDIRSIGYNTNNLVDVDDLDIIELIMRIEKALDVSISDNILEEFNGFLQRVYSLIISKRRDKKLGDLGIN
jgi:acyl carrier protein